MKQINNETFKAQISVDEKDRVREINYLETPWESKQQSSLMAALDYLRQMGALIEVSEAELTNPLEKVSFVSPKEQGVEYRFGGEKQQFDASTIIFNQTYLNVPVWRAAITLTVKHNPNRVLSVVDTSARGMNAPLPSPQKIEEHRRIFALAAADQRLRILGLDDQIPVAASFEESSEPTTASFIRRVLAINETGNMNPAENETGESAPASPNDSAQAIRGRFFVYCYNESKRLSQAEDCAPSPESTEESDSSMSEIENRENPPALSLPPVDQSIVDGVWRVVSEVTFQLITPMFGPLNWRALIDVETDSVLLLEPLVAGNFGFIFHRDPITGSGVLTNTPNSNNSVLNPLRSAVQLPNLTAPVAGRQELRGRFVVVSNVETPDIAPPTIDASARFDFDVRTNDFAAVNDYYHSDRFFALVESLGFSINNYFDHTSFPVRIDHRDNDRGIINTINARCMGNGSGGIGFAGYCLNDLSDTVNPIGRACDSRVHLHELGGHGILYEHVDSPNFRFAHSAGDSLSAILHDPESKLRDNPQLRFKYAPWHPTLNRRFDRKVTDGWAWGGPSTQDDKGYGSEQILSTTLFRIYQAIGGDSDDLNRRLFASRMVIYLILRAVGTLTPATNPSSALSFANALMSVDLLNWTTEGIFGGAYNKVIRWSFEKQGLFQPTGSPTPVRREGDPPDVDVFINDGRSGEYQYQPVYSNNTSIWNRRAADGGGAHQEPIAGVTNFAYVRIKNRGTKTAQNVVVRGFHHKAGGSTVFPTDFQALGTAQLSAGTLAAHGQEEKIVGPFAWVPVADALGQDSLMMVVSAGGDPSNIDHFGSGETIAEWRLVPNDNNIGLRNVFPVAGNEQPAEKKRASSYNLLDELGLSSQRMKKVRVKTVTLEIEMDDEIASLESGMTIAEEEKPLPSDMDWLAASSKNEDRKLTPSASSSNFKWGMQRHAAIAAAAWQIISPETQNEISRIFANSNLPVDLGEAARWADRLKTSNRPDDPATQRFLGQNRNRRHDTWHYVNLPLKLAGYDPERFPEFTRRDDIVQMILLCVESLQDPGPTARFEEINALRWLTHLVGDLHQPVHIGCGYIANPRRNDAYLVFEPDEAAGLESDRGGGILLLPTGDNLHGFWDSKLGPNIIPDPLNSESEEPLIDALRKSAKGLSVRKISNLPMSIAEWANDSLQAASSAYLNLRIISYNPSNGRDYYKVQWEGEASYRKRCSGIVSERMSAAAANLAALLDSIWG